MIVVKVISYGKSFLNCCIPHFFGETNKKVSIDFWAGSGPLLVPRLLPENFFRMFSISDEKSGRVDTLLPIVSKWSQLDVGRT